MDFANMDRDQMTLAASGFLVMLSLHFTFQLVSQHLFYWKNPKEQKAILIIILIAPVYAVDSFVGLLDIRGSKPFFMLLDSVKECYEALAIAKFLALMYSYLKISMSKNIVPDEIKGREIHHSFPMTLFQEDAFESPHIEASQVLDMAVCYPSHMFYLDGNVTNCWDVPQLAQLDVHHHSQPILFLGHVLLGCLLPCLRKRIGASYATGKVYLHQESFSSAFWQGVVLDILVRMGVVRSHHFWLDTEHVEEAIQNVLVCVEMVMFSVIQQYAYHVAPYSGDVESKLKMQKKYE
ncbi:Transmembrane proteinA [Sesamum angolense]|uniref:Transmembrane proteinA n=1 Tax=Sesamum angolense TaxID=2727404 RepID=A0AAE2BVD5_9LAMI|nr:Transmembrane proteinA [Sesamum angolense]